MEHPMSRTKGTTALKDPSIAGHASGNGNGKVFDLASRYMAEEIDIPILDPIDSSPTGMVWTITSQFSKEARGASIKAATLRLNAKGEIEEDSKTAVSDTLLEQLIAVTRRWNAVANGESVPCTPENVRTVLTDDRTAWIRPQVQSAYLSLSRFFGNAKPSS
jgi:hypothetical protein